MSRLYSKKELADSFSMILSSMETLNLYKGGFHMEDKNLWATFEKTGSIVDYLNYKGVHTETRESRTGECKVESDNHSDRNDSVRNTNW